MKPPLNYYYLVWDVTIVDTLADSYVLKTSDLLRNQAIQNQRNSFSRGFPLLFNVETLRAFGAFFQISIIIGNSCIVNQKCYVIMLSIQCSYLFHISNYRFLII
jgi:hypothetical protein